MVKFLYIRKIHFQDVLRGKENEDHYCLNVLIKDDRFNFQKFAQ